MNKLGICLGALSLSLSMGAAMGACSSSSSDDTSANGDASTDGGTLEASAVDHKTPVTADSGPDDASADTCAPVDVSSFTSNWKPPSGLHQKKCTPAQVATFATCVYNHTGRDAKVCDAFDADAANADCLACAKTNTSGTTLGAIVTNGTSVSANNPGCIALVSGDLSANGCGAKVQAALLCEDAACVDVCPVSAGDTAAFNKFLACEQLAAQDGCKAYEDAASCAATLVADGGPASVCQPNTQDFGVRAAAYTELFCGGLTDEAGTDASTDAPADAPDGD